MIESLGNVILKNGEEVEASVVIGPDLDWAPRIGPLLQHKMIPGPGRSPKCWSAISTWSRTSTSCTGTAFPLPTS